MKFGIIVLTLIISAHSLFAQQDSEKKGVYKKYKFKSGVVFYDEKVSSFDNNLNSQVRGIARLVFDNWGAKELKEEDLSEVQSGNFKDKRSRHTLTMTDFGTIYTVDYDDKVIYKTRDKDLDLDIMQRVDLSDEAVKQLKEMGAKIIGKETIAGLECDLWDYNGEQVCLYKDSIPLKIVVKNPGFYSEKKAVQVILNKPIDPKEFELPNFKIINEGTYSDNRAALTRTQDYMLSIADLRREMKKRGINLDDKNLTITPDLEKDIINILGRRYLHKQKKLLPSLIKAMEKAKVCIQNAKSEAEANKCMLPVKKINDLLGDSTPEFDFKNLDDAKKAAAIKELDIEIKNTKITAECVAKNNKTTDVIMCTEGTLDPE